MNSRLRPWGSILPDPDCMGSETLKLDFNIPLKVKIRLIGPLQPFPYWFDSYPDGADDE